MFDALCLGVKIAQIAAVALLADYVVTVAVQTATGTDRLRPVARTRHRSGTRALGPGQPVADSPSLECELVDDSSGITLLFYGRRRIPGLEPGTTLLAEGMVGERQGYLAIATPTHQLILRDYG